MKLRNEVYSRDIDESACRDRQKERHVEARSREISYKRADYCGACAEEVEEKSLLFLEAAVDKHGKVAYLLRNLMDDYREGRGYSEIDVDEICRGDDKAVYEVVHAIPHEYEVCECVDFAFPVMAVPPVDEFLKHEEYHYPCYEKNPDAADVHLSRRFGKKMYERPPEQRAYRESDERKQDFIKQLFLHRQKNSSHE